MSSVEIPALNDFLDAIAIELIPRLVIAILKRTMCGWRCWRLSNRIWQWKSLEDTLDAFSFRQALDVWLHLRVVARFRNIILSKLGDPGRLIAQLLGLYGTRTRLSDEV